MGAELPIRNWRITKALPSGIHVFVDPLREDVRIYTRDPPPDGDGVKLTALEVAEGGESGYLDKVASVSGPDSDEVSVQEQSEQVLITDSDQDLSF